MGQVTIIGIDLAKHSFRLHGAQANGLVAFRRKLSRGKLLDFLASQPRCVVAMEACASAHHWGRENGKSLPQFGLHRAHIDGQVAFAGPPRLRKVEKIAYEALAPVEREQIRGLVGELDAQQCVALHGAGTPASACGGVRQTSVDDALHLLERHPRSRRPPSYPTRSRPPSLRSIPFLRCGRNKRAHGRHCQQGLCGAEISDDPSTSNMGTDGGEWMPSLPVSLLAAFAERLDAVSEVVPGAGSGAPPSGRSSGGVRRSISAITRASQSSICWVRKS